MGQLVFQAALGGQVALSGPNTASSFTVAVPAVTGTMVTTGDTATVTSTMISGPLTSAVGGTGVNNGSATLTLAGNVTHSGAFTQTFTATGNTSLTLPTSGTLQTTTGSLASNTGLPLTTGVTGTLPVANGGTNLTSFTANGVVYASSTSALATGSALTFDGTTLTNTVGGAQFNNLVKISNTANPYIQLYDGTRSGYLQILSGALNLIQTTAQPITFSTNNTEQMRLDSSGNLGIGTSSPAGKLQVIGGSNQSGTAFQTGNFANTGATLGTWVGYDSSNGAVLGSNGVDKPIAFWQYSSGSSAYVERMRIDSSGFACINTNAALASAYLNIKYDPASQYGVVIQNTSTTFNGSFIQFRNSAGTGAGQIISNGTATVAYQTSSDYRLKENIAPMTGALAKVTQLKPVTYTWKADGSEGQGFIAHELQEIVPDCVGGKKDAVDEEGKPVYQGIDTSFLVATLTAAIQEQQTLIQSLTDRLNALESK